MCIFLQCLTKTFRQLIVATDGPDSLPIREYWRQYNILSSVKNMKLAWDEVKNSTMNAVWKKLWPESCIREAVVEMPEIVEIVTLGRTIGGDGFQNLESEDITEVLETNEENITVDDILTQFGDNNKDENDESKEDVEIIEEKKFTSEKLSNFLKLGSQLEQEALDMDPDMERALNFRRNLTAALTPYAEIYKEKQKAGKQSVLTSFFQKQ